ncbi:hypothetical protein L1887_51972 [Cichorium endivia]|nr:hypothetical protein L1887_51972 [Cichorium endivia]
MGSQSERVYCKCNIARPALNARSSAAHRHSAAVVGVKTVSLLSANHWMRGGAVVEPQNSPSFSAGKGMAGRNAETRTLCRSPAVQVRMADRKSESDGRCSGA